MKARLEQDLRDAMKAQDAARRDTVRFALAAIHNGRSEWTLALAQLDTLETWYPGYQAAVVMRQGVLELVVVRSVNVECIFRHVVSPWIVVSESADSS